MDYEKQCVEIEEKFLNELKKFWDRDAVSYSENDMMAVKLILFELITNAVKSSLERMQQWHDLTDPIVKISIKSYETLVAICVEDCGTGLPQNLQMVPLNQFKVVCNYTSGAYGLALIQKLSQQVRIVYRSKLGEITNEFDPKKIDGSIVTAWRFALNN